MTCKPQDILYISIFNSHLSHSVDLLLFQPVHCKLLDIFTSQKLHGQLQIKLPIIIYRWCTELGLLLSSYWCSSKISVWAKVAQISIVALLDLFYLTSRNILSNMIRKLKNRFAFSAKNVYPTYLAKNWSKIHYAN